MKFTKSKLVELIQESIIEMDQEVLQEGPSPIGGMGMGSDASRSAVASPGGPTRRFDPKSAEAFAAKYNFDLNRIAALQNDEAFMNNPATRQAWAQFNDYANVNLPPQYKAKWQAAIATANKAARAQMAKPGLVQKVVGKVQNMFGGKKLSPQTIKEIEAAVGEVLKENEEVEGRLAKQLNENTH